MLFASKLNYVNGGLLNKVTAFHFLAGTLSGSNLTLQSNFVNLKLTTG